MSPGADIARGVDDGLIYNHPQDYPQRSEEFFFLSLFICGALGYEAGLRSFFMRLSPIGYETEIHGHIPMQYPALLDNWLRATNL